MGSSGRRPETGGVRQSSRKTLLLLTRLERRSGKGDTDERARQCTDGGAPLRGVRPGRYPSGVEYLFRPQWALFSNLGLSHHQYSERATSGDLTNALRRDALISVRSGARYTLNDYIQFELAYEYLRRNSNFSTLDYTDHLVSFSSRLAY